MDQTKLNESRTYEEKYGVMIPEEKRPVFHVTPMVGWLNDPNGFSVYQGEYHLFYQYYPYDVHWGPMHWGHVKSSDLIRWERLPAAMAPDREYDGQGVFSGSALEMPDGRHLLMYTGVQGKDNTADCHQTQCIAFGDGINYEKYEGNPVLTVNDIPEECCAKDFRDPKIWWDSEKQRYLAVAGVRVADGSGAIPMFSSENGVAWNYVTMLDYCRNRYGRMWECPDFFEIDDRAVILVSPQEMLAQGMEFHNGNDVICLIGDFDRKTDRFTRERAVAVDYGLDFYAPQSLKTPDGRRVMIGWMQSWESSHLHPDGAKWNGMLTIPRELSLSRGRLIQKPVRELEKYRTGPVIYKKIRLEGRTELKGVSGRILDMNIEICPDGGEPFDRFTMYLAENEEYHTAVIYNPHKNTVCLDRSNSGFRYNIVSGRKAPVRDRNGRIRFRVIMDRFSVELFINDGEQVMSACIYTPPEADGISFEMDGAGRISVEKYEIEL